jgi:hypothetical protein
MLSATRNMAGAQRFFRNTLSVAGQAPAQVTTDGHDSYPCAVLEILGPEVEHRDNAYLNRRIEQDPLRHQAALLSYVRVCCLLLRSTLLFGLWRSPAIFSSSSRAQAVRLSGSSKTAVSGQSSCAPIQFYRHIADCHQPDYHLVPMSIPVPPVLTVLYVKPSNRRITHQFIGLAVRTP